MMYKTFAMFAIVLFACVCAHADDALKNVQLSDDTKKLIEMYRQNPTKEVEDSLRKRVEMRYDSMIARKKNLLANFQNESNDAAAIKKMQQEIDELVKQKNTKIHQTMKRLADKNSKSDKPKPQTYLPVTINTKKISIASMPVTNEQYALFVEKTKHEAPTTWPRGKMPAKKYNHPVTGVSYKDAVAYCEWLTKQDTKHLYRLPTEEEWERAAGPKPEKANINCETKGTSSVDKYNQTLSASGAVDMWGNVWEWTSTSKATARGLVLMNVKGGSWTTPCQKCRTDYRGEAREPRFSDDALGFRVVRED